MNDDIRRLEAFETDVLRRLYATDDEAEQVELSMLADSARRSIQDKLRGAEADQGASQSSPPPPQNRWMRSEEACHPPVESISGGLNNG